MLTLPDPFIAPPCEQAIDILYQDDAILLINKPSGLLSLSGKNPLNLDSVHYRVKQDFPTATLLHRLDFGTSGIMLVALSKEYNALLMRQFQARQIKKQYKAILQGELNPKEGVIDLPIAKGEFPRQVVCYQQGKHAMSEYKVLHYCSQTHQSTVQFFPVTGRTHQLRVHSQAIGHSILGCDLYSEGQSQQAAKRLMLHATELTFSHPKTGQVITAQAECPF